MKRQFGILHLLSLLPLRWAHALIIWGTQHGQLGQFGQFRRFKVSDSPVTVTLGLQLH